MKSVVKLAAAILTLSTALIVSIGAASPVHAQEWPSKPITMIVPFPPGGTSDTNARLVAQEMAKLLGQTIVIDNKPGANGNVGTAIAARAAADGYTIVLSGVGTNGINPGLYKNTQYDPVKDFAHITMIASGPNAIVVHPDFSARTLDDLVKLARDNPGKYSYASSGTGSSGHMAMEMFKQRAGLKIEHVPYKGGAQALQDVLGGQVPILITNADAVLPHIKSGKLRGLAVTSAARNPLFPDTPTIAEQGFPGFAAVSWTGISAPARTPPAVVARLHAEAVKALNSAELKKRLEDVGLVVGGDSPEDYTRFVAAEAARWAEVARSAGITVE